MTEQHITEMASAIVAAHRATFTSDTLPSQPVPAPSRSEPAYLAALQACSALGFIAIDAECLAQAWQRQTERTGQFDAAHWPDDPQDFGLAGADPTLAFPECPRALGLYGVLPTAEWVGRMARAGVPTVQLRFKSDDQAAIRREVQAAVAAVQGTNARLFINDHWQAAIDAGAYGIHVGQEDLDALEGAQLDAIRASGLRLGVRTSGCSGMAYVLEFVDEPTPEDIVFEDKGVKVVVDGKSLQFLDGTQLDFVKEGLNEGFKFTNPNVKDECGCGESFHV